MGAVNGFLVLTHHIGLGIYAENVGRHRTWDVDLSIVRAEQR
jgi:hypothetical protein